MQIDGPLLIVGCGKMGGALLDGWLDRGLPANHATIVEPAAEAALRFVRAGAKRLSDGAELPADFRPGVVLLAVKPQYMDAALAPLKRLALPGTLFLSIAAGRTLASFAQRLGPDLEMVRAMPNTPAAVGRGMSVLVANDRASAEQRRLAESLMAAVGETAWVEEERLLDVVTAVSGGGPAYVFLLAEVLAEAGRANGLPAELAARLARVTVAGSGELLHRARETPAELRRNVTSPAGTTLEALKVLMAEDALQPLMTRAIAAATRRSRELAG
ncbi:MAG TPA: pyrroline-5-carboxylate reductase [Kiloniellales bacterium]|nr:pyrroline-5-carboxylate reductase [Kiloniellales bacterium]